MTQPHMTAKRLHETMLHTHRIVQGYDIDEVDELLEECESALCLQEQMIQRLEQGIRKHGLTIESILKEAEE